MVNPSVHRNNGSIDDKEPVREEKEHVIENKLDTELILDNGSPGTVYGCYIY